ncbi:MAG: hypothetical protein BGO31_12870 [Bacteroidetes bacterium 43-16]|nr:MAG: hypothetical protein BGO31_12870 [Bacteroidetes bacterium 43-16]
MKNYLESFWFRLGLVVIVALYVTELGSLDTMVTRLRTVDFYKEYAATVLISLCIVELVFYINKRLDTKVPWHGHLLTRLLLQVMLNWITPLFLVFGLAALYFFVYGVDIFRTDYLYYGFPFVVILILSLNVILVMTPYCLIGIQQMKAREEPTLLGEQEPLNAFNEEQKWGRVKVLDGTSVLLFQPQDIAATYIVGGRVIVKDNSEKEYLTDLTLDELEKEYLPKDNFFRINRQLIASSTVCRAYDPLDFGKLEVKLSVSVPVNTVVSQLKAKSFKDWIEN